ncbi:hypothetical protein Dimus_034003 [Dionaea muscipula]
MRGGRRGWPKGRPRKKAGSGAPVSVPVPEVGVQKSPNREGSSEGREHSMMRLEQVSQAADCESAGCESAMAGSSEGRKEENPGGGGYFAALTCGKGEMIVEHAQDQEVTMEGNKALCNGMKLSYVDRRDEVEKASPTAGDLDLGDWRREVRPVASEDESWHLLKEKSRSLLV